MRTCLTLAFALCIFFNARAWNEIGHRTSGGVAYHYLKANNPQVLKKVLDDLKVHPFVKGAWATELAGLNADQRDARLFMLASQWPDEVRKNTLYTSKKVHDVWHYTNYPITFKPNMAVQPPKDVNIEVVLRSLIDSCKIQKRGNPLQLSWVFHLMQDLHQPLHTVSLFSDDHPKGDKGGNETYIQFPNTKNPVKLHGFWDALVTGSQEKTFIKSAELLKSYQSALKGSDKFKASGLANITTESKALAIAAAYGNGTVIGTKKNPTPVTGNYRTQNRPIAERRVVQAGLRLSALLIEVYGGG